VAGAVAGGTIAASSSLSPGSDTLDERGHSRDFSDDENDLAADVSGLHCAMGFACLFQPVRGLDRHV
jgi:hypothetical protein